MNFFPALGGKESTAKPPPQPIPNETLTLSPQNPVYISCDHLWSPRSSKPSPTSLFGVHSKFRTVPDSRSPTVPRWPGAFWYQPSWAPSSLPAALAQVSGCSRRLPPAQFLPPDSARRDGAGLVSRTRGAANLSLLSLCKGLLGTSLRNGPTQGLWLGTPVKGVEHQNKYGRTK